MARWTDLATWRGPTPNCGDGDQYPNEGDDRMREHRGLVIHIAEGYFEGTIAYQKNPDANVSSHFVLSDGAKGQGADGELAQVVDTDITAWTQRSGNGHWLSVECAGFTPNPLTAAQCESVAQLLARAHRVYGVPLQLATNPDGRGLGHHSMGCNWPSGAWGHCDCPGPAIIAQKPAILARAIEIANGDDVEPVEVWTGVKWGSQTAADRLLLASQSAKPADVAAAVKPLADAIAALSTPVVDTAALAAAVAEALRPDLEAAAEAAVRRVLGAVDGVTPPPGS